MGGALHRLQAEGRVRLSGATVPRVLVVVCDSWGVGDAPDAAAYGDEGADTLGNTSRAVGGLRAPALGGLGLGHLTAVEGVPPGADPGTGHGRATECSAGKDTTTGHWEMMGIRLDEPFPLYPHGFPPEIMGPFEAAIGLPALGNEPASGTEIIARARRGAPGDRSPHRLHERRLRVPDRGAQGHGRPPDALRVVPDGTPAPDGAAPRGARDRPAVRGAAGGVRAQPRATGLLGAAAGADGARPSRRCRRGGLRDRQDPGHLLGSGDHRGALLGLERPRRRPHARVPAPARGRRSCSRTSWTSTRSTATATTPTGYAAAIEAFDRRLPEVDRRARRGSAADHRRPRVRPDQADSTDHTRERTPLLAAGLPGGPTRSGPGRRSATSAHTVADLLGVEVEGLDGRSFKDRLGW